MDIKEVNELLTEISDKCRKLRIKMLDYNESEGYNKSLQNSIICQLYFIEEASAQLLQRHELKLGGEINERQ